VPLVAEQNQPPSLTTDSNSSVPIVNQAQRDEEEDLSFMAEAAVNLALLRDASPRPQETKKGIKRSAGSAAKRTPKKLQPSSASKAKDAPRTKGRVVASPMPAWPTVLTVAGDRVPIEGISTVTEAEAFPLYHLSRIYILGASAAAARSDVAVTVKDDFPHVANQSGMKQPNAAASSLEDFERAVQQQSIPPAELLSDAVSRGRRIRQWWKDYRANYFV